MGGVPLAHSHGAVCIATTHHPRACTPQGGKGGRNQEIALAAAREIAGQRGMVVLSAGTDGTDGPTDAAGAVCDGGTLARARAKGLDVDAFLANNDAYNFFAQLGDGLLITGPTGTNVADVAFLLVGAAE